MYTCILQFHSVKEQSKNVWVRVLFSSLWGRDWFGFLHFSTFEFGFGSWQNLGSGYRFVLAGFGFFPISI